ncbi:MAG: hypothetical protein E3J90_00185 [Promethearchaeota archaeon]|nr:MAG: hypothetical protein E3J90_00185 [Candidatus Lokiarchaeota archaeon]
MRNYKIALIIAIVLLVGGGVGFVITGFVSAGSIENSFNFTYEPSSPDPIEELTFNVDIGKILFMYNTTPTTAYAEIDVDIEVTGLYMEGKTYTNFFNPSTEWWDNTTAVFNFISLPDVWYDPSHWFKSYNITIAVTLRTDIVYDLTALTAVGSIEMQVPDGVILNGLSLASSVGSIKLNSEGNNEFLEEVRLESSTGSVESSAAKTNFTQGFLALTSTGSVSLNFTNCLMGDNLIGTVSTGSVTFKSYNMVYTKDILLNLESSTGSIDVELYQYISMGANVTGSWATSTGSIDVLYRDNLVNTNVRFVGSTSVGSINYTPHATMAITSLGSVYSTLNYGDAMYRYVFSLDTSTGSVNANAQSA